MNTMENNSTNTSFTDAPHVGKILLIPNILTIALGVPLNLSVLGLILAGALVKVSEITALNQILCELGICVGSMVGIIRYYSPSEHLQLVYRFFFGLAFVGRLLFMSLVCAGCYIAVAHPVAFLRIKPRRIQLAVSGVCWSAVLAFCVACIVISIRMMALVSFIVTVIIVTGQLVGCVQILRLLVRPPPGERRPESRGMDGMKLRAFTIIAVLLVSTLITFLPFIIVSSLVDLMPPQELIWVAYMSIFGGCSQPLLWVYRARKLPCIRAP